MITGFPSFLPFPSRSFFVPVPSIPPTHAMRDFEGTHNLLCQRQKEVEQELKSRSHESKLLLAQEQG